MAETYIGNLTEDLTEKALKKTSDGRFQVGFQLMRNRRFRDDKGQWQDKSLGGTRVVVSNEQAQALASFGFTTRDRLIVVGTLINRSYEKGGETHWITEIEVDEIGPSFRFAKVDEARKLTVPEKKGAAAAPVDAKVQALRDLKALMDEGVLDAAEFAAEKARILGGSAPAAVVAEETVTSEVQELDGPPAVEAPPED